MDRSDYQLLSDIAAGNQTAFAQFYDRHAPRVLGVLLRWLSQRPDAEDVLQETFWQVWSHAGRYDPERSAPQVWLFMIARSRALDHLRRCRPEAPLPPDPGPAPRNDPAGAAERDEAARQVLEALGRLPEEQRSALALAFYGGLTHEQVARRQQVPLGTVKTRIRLGMRRLRDLLPG